LDSERSERSNQAGSRDAVLRRREATCFSSTTDLNKFRERSEHQP
jgi:hypothetical protein